MYRVPLKSLLVYALKQVFDSEFPQQDFRKANIGIEYPVDKQEYPGIWVDFSETAPLRQAGVAHVEQVINGNSVRTGTRFRFEGTASFTIVAMTSLERDRFYDEVIRVFAFGDEDSATSQFRQVLEDNDLIAVNARFDEIEVGGNASAPGTPWGTDEIIYETTVSLDLVGEFVADPVARTLIALSQIIVTPFADLTTPTGPVEGLTPADDGKGAWM